MGCQTSRNEISSAIQAKIPDAKFNIDKSDRYYIVQLFTGCLAEMAYYIESDKEAAIIDPLREIDPYLEIAKKRGATIKYVFLTHFHADFVSGHCDLAKKTGAQIVFGPTAKAEFEFHLGADNEIFKIGQVELKLLHTPGHTQESSSYLLLDQSVQKAVFTGDTLFLGEVGRPDLAVKAGEITKEDLAGWMFDSLRNKIMKLDHNVTVYPGHGAGSPCGKKIAEGASDTLANQLKTNYALDEKVTKQDFINILTADLPTPPMYFFHDVAMNRSNALPVDSILEKNFKFLNPQLFLAELQKHPNILILDSRPPKVFEAGFVKGSINVSLSVNFAIFVGTLFKPDTLFLIVSEPGKEKETIVRLARIGYDNVLGCLEGGWAEFKAGEGHAVNQNSDKINSIPATELKGDEYIVDVRNAPELTHGSIEGAINLPLSQLQVKLVSGENLPEIPKDKPVYLHCKSGARSMIACSLLKKAGYVNQINVDGGFDTISKENHKVKFINLNK